MSRDQTQEGKVLSENPRSSCKTEDGRNKLGVDGLGDLGKVLKVRLQS